MVMRWQALLALPFQRSRYGVLHQRQAGQAATIEHALLAYRALCGG
jgi:hypothetical protein